MTAVKTVLKDLLSSKKFLVMLGGVLVWLLARFGLDISQHDVDAFVALIASFVVGQGIADHGKEAVKATATIVVEGDAEKAKLVQ